MLRRYAVVALMIGVVMTGAGLPAGNRDEGSVTVDTAVLQVATAEQETGGGDDAPPVVGAQAQLIFLAFLVVMLLVPWLMAREGLRGRAVTGGPATDVLPPGSLFSSRRERQLWLWTLVVLIAIYTTLGPAAEVAAALRARNLLRITMGAFLALVVLLVVAPWIKDRPSRGEVGAGIGIAAVYATTVIRIPVPEARSHLFEYGLVALLIHHALAERRRNGRRVPVPALTALVATTLLGWLDEGVQALIPSRTYDLVDVGFNAIAAAMAISASLLMTWVRGLAVFGREDRLR